MWAELSRHGLAHGRLVACHNIATKARDDAAEMNVIDDGQAANG